MAKKPVRKKQPLTSKAYIEGAGVVVEQEIDKTLEENYMPYAMSVIVSRAIPEIDGFKPSHRKILYTMYKMGLLSGARTKSANIVGQTMKLNPHGDAAIYETMVRLSKGYEALLHPYVDSKGNFGKAYSRDMAYAASRYTEAKLSKICNELFADIDKETVEFVDNYDSTTKEPTLLPTSYPSILVNSNIGIAVGMASSICPFNLKEICLTTASLIKDPEHEISATLLGPDFPGGGFLVADNESLEKVYQTGRGGIKIRSRYTFDKSANCIDITEIPPSTTVEAIMDKIVEQVKANKLKEISDMRDETDLSGLKLTIDLKRGTDPEKLMQKLFKTTPLEDSFSCNFNVLINGHPKVLGVKELLNEWIIFRKECVRKRTQFDLDKKLKRLHLLKGLESILLDIDLAVKIVRETKTESEVVPNLMIGFGIDDVQAEYVAEIKLRHLNEEYILKRTAEIKSLLDEIENLRSVLDTPKKLNKIIIDELANVSKEYGQDRKTLILDVSMEEEYVAEQDAPSYPVHVFFSKEGYFKKITPASLRMSSEQRYKDGDSLLQQFEADNKDEVLFFTNLSQVYKAKLNDFADTKASVLGDYVASKLEMDEGETPIFSVITSDYSGEMVFIFENGKAARVPLSSYETKTNRKKLVNAYSDKSPLVGIFICNASQEITLTSLKGKGLVLDVQLIPLKVTKSTQGVNVFTMRKGDKVYKAAIFDETALKNSSRYRTKKIPAVGAALKEEDTLEQITF